MPTESIKTTSLFNVSFEVRSESVCAHQLCWLEISSGLEAMRWSSKKLDFRDQKADLSNNFTSVCQEQHLVVRFIFHGLIGKGPYIIGPIY